MRKTHRWKCHVAFVLAAVVRGFAEHCVAIPGRLAVGAVILAEIVGKGAGAPVV